MVQNTVLNIFFIATTLITVVLFQRANRNSKNSLFIIAGWAFLQAALALLGFYTKDTLSPRFAFLAMPPLIFILFLFLTNKGRKYIDILDLKSLTLLHIIRIPLEFLLFWLAIEKAIPVLMTFEGRNFDIISGLSAPLIYYFGFVKNTISKKVILVWNFIGLGLLINIVINAALSVPSPVQQQAFDQPNIAVLHFPFVWLPALIVPLVLLAHLASIRQLLKVNQND